jgi:hypothetical protein
LRCNFVVAAHLEVRLTPQFLRALHMELFTKPSFGWLFARSSIFGSALNSWDSQVNMEGEQKTLARVIQKSRPDAF